MRIIVFLNSLGTGGAEFSTLIFYGWLLKKGYSVKLVCYKKADPSYDPRQFGFEEVHYLEGKSMLSRLLSLNILLRNFRPDLVHSVLFNANILTRLSRMINHNFLHLESLVNEMYSAYRYSDPNVTRLKLEGYRLLDKFTNRWGVDHFHANGKSVAAHYIEKVKIAKELITVIPRGRSINPFVGDSLNRDRVRKELATGDRLMIINIARQEYQKGIDVLLNAVHNLGEGKEALQIVLVGREGNISVVIQKLIRDFELGEHVALLGHRNDISSLLAAADVFVFPSRFEGLPGALIEAEAAGLPLICSDIPNNHEVAVKNTNALFFPNGDSSALVNCLRQMITNADLRKKFGVESQQIFREHFDLDKVHRSMETLINQLIKQRKAGFP